MMKKSLTLMVSLIALTLSLSACGKSPEEKMADTLSGGSYDRDKEVKRLNEIGKKGDEAFAKLLGKPAPAQKSEAKN